MYMCVYMCIHIYTHIHTYASHLSAAEAPPSASSWPASTSTANPDKYKQLKLF